MRRAIFVSALLLSLLGASAARADGGEDERLILEGQALVAKGEYPAACALFERANAVAPSGKALLNWADCLEHNGQYASAHARFVEAADRALAAGRSDIETMARTRARELSGRLSTLTIRFSDPPAGAHVFRDDVEIPRSSWGVALPVDPGAHRVTVTAPGREKLAIDVSVGRDHTNAEVVVPRLSSSDAPPPVAVFASSPLRPIGVTLAALGGASIVVGAVFGGLAAARHGTVADACPDNRCPDVATRDAVLADNDASRAFALASTLSLVAGAVVAAVGLTLFFVAPKHASAAGFLGPGSGVAWRF